MYSSGSSSIWWPVNCTLVTRETGSVHHTLLRGLFNILLHILLFFLSVKSHLQSTTITATGIDKRYRFYFSLWGCLHGMAATMTSSQNGLHIYQWDCSHEKQFFVVTVGLYEWALPPYKVLEQCKKAQNNLTKTGIVWCFFWKFWMAQIVSQERYIECKEEYFSLFYPFRRWSNFCYVH